MAELTFTPGETRLYVRLALVGSAELAVAASADGHILPTAMSQSPSRPPPQGKRI